MWINTFLESQGADTDHHHNVKTCGFTYLSLKNDLTPITYTKKKKMFIIVRICDSCILVNNKIYCPTLQSILTSLGQQILILISTEVNTCLLLTSTFRRLPTILVGIPWQAKVSTCCLLPIQDTFWDASYITLLL